MFTLYFELLRSLLFYLKVGKIFEMQSTWPYTFTDNHLTQQHLKNVVICTDISTTG